MTGMSIIFSTVAALCMGVLAIFVRMKASQKPVSPKKILLPPVFMSTGALMFLHPYFRVTATEVLEAVIIGMLFSILLIKTSKFELREEAIYLKRSKAFGVILIGLLLIRLLFKSFLSQSVDVGELSGMFWILAFGMIVPWRLTMYFQYKKLSLKLNQNQSVSI
ncbi:CcdC family protein [Siminovitchia terrae]|uniref:CcdC family protein n=1 Tax=Siminovitchia terrae TaxID=1914933 RepID=UPI001BB39958|nr:cytochrome c biogenesis protein CcdC [Siminovitchia terrae]